MSSTRLKAGAMALIPKNHRISHAHVRCKNSHTYTTTTATQGQKPPKSSSTRESTELVKRELPTFLGTPQQPQPYKASSEVLDLS